MYTLNEKYTEQPPSNEISSRNVILQPFQEVLPILLAIANGTKNQANALTIPDLQRYMR